MGGIESDGSFLGAFAAFENKLADHRDELRMYSDRFSSLHVEPDLFALLLGLGVEVEQHLHMIRHKSDRHDDDVLDIGRFFDCFQMIANVGLQPWLRRWAGATLVDEIPIVVADLLHH